MDKINKNELREFSLSSVAVDNATSIFLLTIMIFIFGVMAYLRMPKEQYPEASLPTVFVNTPYFGNSAADIENLVSRPLEKELMGITGIKDVNSTSMQDYSVITAEFDANLDIDDVIQDVKDAVDKAKSELPNDLTTDPEVVEVNFSEIPIVTVNISGDFTMDELRSYGEKLEDDIEDLKEISKVDMKGAVDREVKVNLDLVRMQALQVTFQDVENAIASENMNMSGGEILNNDFRRAVRIVGEFENVEEINDLIVKSENQRPIYLRDIGKASFDFEDRTSYARSDQLPVVSLDVIKRSGGNLLNAADKIEKLIENAKATYLPEDLKVSLFNDQSINTRVQVASLQNSIISGVILVVLVLLFFLGLKNSMFVGLAIPISMLTGILILFVNGTIMNIVVLFALILALGLLVDNAIVVVENIYRYMQNGYSGKQAAKYGVGEVAWPIIASTATTLAAFLPLAFWPGLMGEFMFYLPYTLIIVLASSLFVALIINPVFTAQFMTVDEKVEDKAERKSSLRNFLIGAMVLLLIAVGGHLAGVMWIRNLFGIVFIITMVNHFLLKPASFFFQEKGIPLLEKAYDKFIRVALKRFIPIGIFVGTIMLFFASIGLMITSPPPIEFFPSADPIYINVFVELPMGKDIEATNRIMKDLELKVEETIKSNKQIVDAVLSQIGENTSDPNSPPEPGVTPNKARLTIAFVPAEERGGISTTQIMEDIRANLVGYAGVQITVDKNADGPPTGKPINLELRGDDIDQLAILSEDILAYINSKKIPGIEELKSDVKIGKPELEININREVARRYEVSTFTIASAIRTSIFGKEVSKFKQGEDEYPIYVRLDKKYRNSVTDLMNQKITFRNPANGQIVQVPISAVANIKFTSTYSSIKRKNQDRMITIFSNLLDGYNANEIVAEMKEDLADYKFPQGVTYEFTGEQQQQAEDMAFIGSAFIVAIFLIFIILVTQFNSLYTPFIILLSVIFSTIGVLLGYVFTGQTFSIIFSGVGIVSLAGVVVNNAIVLIDYVNLLIKRKREGTGQENIYDMTKQDVKEAIIEGGATRLRPVLLTAITTVLGLIPLAIGFNFDFFTLISDLDPNIFIGGDNTAIWGPMAWTVIYGLVFATFLTLVVVPVMYWLVFRWNYWIKNAVFKKKQISEPSRL